MTTVMATTMREKIVEAQRRSGSCVCVGLDPDPSKMPIDNVFEFNRARLSMPLMTWSLPINPSSHSMRRWDYPVSRH